MFKENHPSSFQPPSLFFDVPGLRQRRGKWNSFWLYQVIIKREASGRIWSNAVMQRVPNTVKVSYLLINPTTASINNMNNINCMWVCWALLPVSKFSPTWCKSSLLVWESLKYLLPFNIPRMKNAASRKGELRKLCFPRILDTCCVKTISAAHPSSWIVSDREAEQCQIQIPQDLAELQMIHRLRSEEWPKLLSQNSELAQLLGTSQETAAQPIFNGAARGFLILCKKNSGSGYNVILPFQLWLKYHFRSSSLR